ncbi:uncharacterized protein Tco025E_08140 [Trypanosoma conorhini]|uniref:JmjC domain-containing protein n=1 Tax=Trypanosoma conorhini TaxID=83891 RepID=A0A3R7NKZ3_9TRYP|nr:uncharacterized protein Tco025E_08140 [Trypanosoma conorhini]RNF04170.1 hypothetical protein Tco025E_08140 [Trypanosoma conorhini]
MLRPTASCLKLKRRNSPYVQKFLEGCPLPATLVDDLAGANLRSSAPFFTTMPRYIVARENRLSKLFFHHALYPAGGARLPCRVVVVRGGRGVRNQPQTALPASQRASAEATCRVQQDPARRSFFYARPVALTPPRLRHDVHPNASEAQEAAVNSSGMDGGGRETAAVSPRPAEDSVLAPLCGVIESHFAALLKLQAADEASGGAGRAIWEELTGLLSGGHGGVVTNAEGVEEPGASHGDVVGALLRSAASAPSSFFHVHSQLPSSALFLTRPPTDVGAATHAAVAPLGKGGADHTQSSVVARLAGGLEPAVPFAVGYPLPVRRSAACGAPDGKADAAADIMPFGHIQCLLRVCTSGGAAGEKSAEEIAESPKACGETASPMHASDAAASAPRSRASKYLSGGGASPSVPTGIVEPWKLGVSLDPKIPFYLRTMTERRFAAAPTGSAGADASSASPSCVSALLGRSDCETYLLPQRELLFTFYAPAEVVAMCAKQNEERMQRQAALGYGGPTHAFADAPRTARRLLQGAHCNHVAAEAAAAASKSDTAAAHTPQRDSAVYEVRALPGDVVFVPRGWRYHVERIIGTAVMDAVAAAPTPAAAAGKQAGAEGLPRAALRAAFLHNAPSTFTSSLRPAHAASHKTGASTGCVEAAAIRGVEVEAFVLCYKPYPFLSAEQAATYVPANYVRRGVEEFYAKGGNDVFHRYV